MVDEIELLVRAGDGGDGAVSFRREKFVPFGGPDGGDGGAGGAIYVTVDTRLFSLSPLRYRKRLRAVDGGRGSGRQRTGKGGDDLVVAVPAGTLVYADEAGERRLLADLVDEGERVRVARGGKGGLGNMHFATPVDQAPKRATRGAAGEEHRLVLELRLVMDIGIVGRPNAGKSTLLGRLSHARPRVAPYPFTTTEPELGIGEVDFCPLVIGEIPGLIEGAHIGRGLGDLFLRHTERARVLLHLLDGSSAGLREEMDSVNRELEQYNPALAAKPQVVAVNKVDLPEVQARLEDIRMEFKGGAPLFLVSAATGDGVGQLLRELVARLAMTRAERRSPSSTVIRPQPLTRRG
ncbi:MAG: GTPase ObgE [Dehalococcoidia bacterium]|jgi:GTP-binding protein|nr:GTPase ObgE [Dehalococcoidia bacterium]